MAIQSFAKHVLEHGVLREIERRMFQLNANVTAVRKGVRNTLNRWLGGGTSSHTKIKNHLRHGQNKREHGGRARAPDTTGMMVEDGMYTCDSIEAQIRYLADLAFRRLYLLAPMPWR